MNPINILQSVSKISLFIVVGLIPLWFLPLTVNFLEYQKQVLLSVLVFLGVVTWFWQMLTRNKFSFRVTWIHICALFVLLTVGISTVFSLFGYGSFWGWPLDSTDNFLTTVVFVLLFFLISNLFSQEKHLLQFLFTLLCSGTIAVVFGILQLFEKFILPFRFAQSNVFNTIGTPSSLAIFAAILLPIALSLSFIQSFKFRWFAAFFSVVLFGAIVILNLVSAWLVVLGGTSVLLVFGMLQTKQKNGFAWVSFPMALVVISLFFVFFRVSIPVAPPQSLSEISISRAGQLEITKQVFANPLRIGFGSGPGTFVFDYTKFHSSDLNKTIVWSTRFNSGISEVLDWLVTKGLLGVLALFALGGVAVISGVKFLMRSRMSSGSNRNEGGKAGESSALWMAGLGILASLVSAFIGHAFYSSNFVLWFVTWVLLGCLGVLSAGKVRALNFSSESALSIVPSFLFLIALMFGVGFLFLGGQRYGAEIVYLQGIRASQRGDIDGAIAKISSATRMNRSSDLYQRILAQLFVGKFNQVARNQELSQEERVRQLQLSATSAAEAARRAAEISPADVVNWSVLGSVYRSFIGASPGVENDALESYKKAIELEPASPFGYTEIARVYILQAQDLARKERKEDQQQALRLALENLQKAIELKDDYATAHYFVAVVYDQQGKNAEAIAKLEETKQKAPTDIGLSFQLGMIYWQKKDVEKAQAEFERVKGMNSEYSNARYMLGLVYDRKGEKERAIEEFMAVSTLNPDNEEVKAILRNLQRGRNALDGIVPSQPPIGESPAEITGEAL